MDKKKVREAIEELKILIRTNEDIISDDKNNDTLYVKLRAKTRNYKTAIEALEKQLAIKPNLEGDGFAPDGTFVYDIWECPKCGVCYEVDYDDYDCCPNCGQRLDWSE